MADREGDLYDLFAEALAPTDRPTVQLLVRAPQDRPVAPPQKSRWDFLAAQRVSGRLKIKAPRKNDQPVRLATLSIRYAPVTLRPPCLKENQPPLTPWAVEARETRPPQGATPVCRPLLTTRPVASFAAAVE